VDNVDKDEFSLKKGQVRVSPRGDQARQDLRRDKGGDDLPQKLRQPSQAGDEEAFGELAASFNPLYGCGLRRTGYQSPTEGGWSPSAMKRGHHLVQARLVPEQYGHVREDVLEKTRQCVTRHCAVSARNPLRASRTRNWRLHYMRRRGVVYHDTLEQGILKDEIGKKSKSKIPVPDSLTTLRGPTDCVTTKVPKPPPKELEGGEWRTPRSTLYVVRTWSRLPSFSHYLYTVLPNAICDKLILK